LPTIWWDQFQNNVYDNNNAIGLGVGVLEPGFGAAWDAVRAAPGAYTNVAKTIAKVGGAGLVGLNVALTYHTISTEIDNGKFNTHSIVNGVVTGIGVGLTVTSLVITAPVWGTALAVTGAVVGVGYGIAQVAGIDGWIDSNWGFK
jgi:VIT1/CCC1 family predicted Fe2+/Mn2+ transporter